MISTKIIVKYHHPYTDKCEGPGRWYLARSDKGYDIGYVWTNDQQGLGILSTSDEYDSQSIIDWFLYSRNLWGERGVSATEAFESYFVSQSEWAGTEISIESGDLQSGLLLRVDGEMANTNYVEYGVTVRDDGEVLELIRHDPTGSFIRDSGNWAVIDPDAPEEDYPTVYGQEWHEVSEDIIEFYDKNSSGDGVSMQSIQSYII